MKSSHFEMVEFSKHLRNEQFLRGLDTPTDTINFILRDPRMIDIDIEDRGRELREIVGK